MLQPIGGGARWLLSEGVARLPLPGLGRLVHSARRAPATHPAPAGAWWAGDPRWYTGDTPPRRHNRVIPLVDGARYFAALAEALAASQAYVYIAGWCLSPDFPLLRDGPDALIASRLLVLLAAVARRVPVRVLLWSGAPVMYTPTAEYARKVQARLDCAGGDIACRLDHSAHFSHTHHQKAVVVDGRVAFVGGMDLTTFDGDRADVYGHPLRGGMNWHDVQLQVEGEAVADVEANFRQRWAAVTQQEDLPHRDPPVDPAWQTPAQVVRTIPRGVYPSAPQGEFGIHHAMLTAIAGARRLIYLENQYLWSHEIVGALLDALRRPHDSPFRLVIVLPAQASDGRWDNDKHVHELRAADGKQNRVGIYTLYASGPHAGDAAFSYRPIYVHAKVMLIDDEWLMIGSANLNTRGLRTDGEMSVIARDPDVARGLREELWAEHLRLPRAEVAAADPIALVDRVWPAQAKTNAAIMRARRRPLISPVQRYVRSHAPGDWLLEDAQSLTFEH